MNNTYEKPEFNKEAFNCPFCGVYAKMDFANFSNAAWQINSSIDRKDFPKSNELMDAHFQNELL